MEEATILSCAGLKIGAYVILSQKASPPTTKHDVGEDIEFPGQFLEAELVGEIPLAPGETFTLLSDQGKTRVKVKSSQFLPEGSAFSYIKISAA